MKKYSIYLITCPITNKPMYVGQTTGHILKRLCNHVSRKSNNQPINKWIEYLVNKKNVLPIISTLEVVSRYGYPNERERYWIKFYKKENPKLLNVSNGGRGVSLSGENHPLAKFTKEMVKEIRRLYETGDFTQQELGVKFGMSRSHISKLTLGKRRNPKYARYMRIKKEYEKKSSK